MPGPERYRIAMGGWIAAAWCLGVSPVAAQLYDDAALQADAARYEERFNFLLERGLRDFLTAEERGAVEGVTVIHPLRGAGPLAFKFAPVAGEAPTIVAPAATLKFVEDLSVVYAWRYLQRQSLEPIDEYLAMLKHRADKFGAATSDPLSALGVPSRVWESNKAVDDLSLRFRNSAWAFLLAHELGHLRLGHLEKPRSAHESQQREAEADAFAVDVLARSGTIPMGAVLWLQASAGYMRNRSDFDSDAAYEAWLRDDASHPVNGTRMRHLASAMRDQARQAADANSAETLEFIAVRLEAIGEIVEDPEIQAYLRHCADVRRAEELSRADDRPCK
ncbi:hypothetical protein DEA8626_03372 [Defluviimonas aquaemixtae]|uniref:IrrE N-terminal-like domain-containing protein n=1 Tax=Albidovulum aquaemixtae TaxID=1542388 RepID=A0A2R8BLR2_9RHOB|nr:hypothetical protein [Defluviimonas aquaemixtae]SPH24321.1 hypothetical protein DEA8626_03372 [Defluviimonas aquaemixtae]